MKNTHPANRYLLGDEGYLGKRLHDQLKQMDAISEKHGWRQKAQWSSIDGYSQNNRTRSLTGFQARLEIAILTYNLAYCLERFN